MLPGGLIPKPRLDLHRLRKDAPAYASQRIDLAPGVRHATGLMALVYEHQEDLIALQVSGLTWTPLRQR